MRGANLRRLRRNTRVTHIVAAEPFPPHRRSASTAAQPRLEPPPRRAPVMTEKARGHQDPATPLSDRVDGLLARLTTAEKVALLHQHQAPVPRLGLGPFRTGTEALHGVAWLGEATVFPQAVGLGSTWDPDLVRRVGTAVGEEVRGLHAKDPAGIGLNVWAPVVNPLRDPRWGRNEEGYA